MNIQDAIALCKKRILLITTILIMKNKTFGCIQILVLVVTLYSFQANAQNKDEKIRVSLQKRVPSDLDKGALILVNDIQEWNADETAIIICDMWDKHWCKGMTERVAELAPQINKVVSIARDRGALIVHAPSDNMDYYKDHPGRKLGKRYNLKSVAQKLKPGKLACEPDKEWPLEFSNDGCDDQPVCKPKTAWTKQINTIKIEKGDAISDSGLEIGSLFVKKRIKNVILLGVASNMCILTRSFGLRNMERLGMNAVFMRDLSDVMHDSDAAPYVSHYTGNSLMNAYIEKFISPTMVSTDLTGEKQFRFKEDQRPLVAFIMAESEYRADQRLPEFANELLLTKNVDCEFALGKPIMEGEGRHNIENLQILNDADLAVFFIRRRALEPEKMALIKNYVASGKPVIGIRTASHSFDPKGNVPREGGGIVAAKGKVDDFLANWTEFDKDILGGNYQGHHGHLEEGTKISIVPGMQNHPVLKGVSAKGFTSPNWLYRNNPLRSANAQVLLTGTIPDEASEPVLWINKNTYGKAIYTSMGHWDDWEIGDFKNIMLNSVDYLLNLENKN